MPTEEGKQASPNPSLSRRNDELFLLNITNITIRMAYGLRQESNIRVWILFAIHCGCDIDL